jgi:hypothetical protein
MVSNLTIVPLMDFKQYPYTSWTVARYQMPVFLQINVVMESALAIVPNTPE